MFAIKTTWINSERVAPASNGVDHEKQSIPTPPDPAAYVA